MLTAELIKQIRQIQLRAGHQVTEALAGNYLSAFKGRGMEFDEVREYVPGDDVRTIDWNVTARTSTPHVKVLREERELTLMLMVDASPSQGFGTGGRLKNEVAAELAAVLAFLAIRNSDKVGLMVFSDHVEHFIPPKKGRAHVWRLIQSVLTHEGSGATTDIATAVDQVANILRRRSVCFLISDFWADGYQKSLKTMARRHDVVCVRTKDPFEDGMIDAGVVVLQDAETGERHVVDSGDRQVRRRLEQLCQDHERELTGFFRREGIDHFSVTTGETVVGPLVRYMRARQQRQERR